MSNWYKKLQNKGLKWGNTKYSWIVMFICAFADACVFPLPTPVFFIAFALLNMQNAYKLAFAAIVGTIIGMSAGYLIGHFLWLTTNNEFTHLAHFFFQHIPGFSIEHYNKIRVLFLKWDFLIFIFAGYTPIPLMSFSISSGIFNSNILIVLFATLIGQGFLYFLLAYLIVKIGPEFKRLFDKSITFITLVISIIIIIIIVLIKLL
jgi:membrane protein YqaA with SNARE-associated domain